MGHMGERGGASRRLRVALALVRVRHGWSRWGRAGGWPRARRVCRTSLCLRPTCKSSSHRSLSSSAVTRRKRRASCSSSSDAAMAFSNPQVRAAGHGALSGIRISFGLGCELKNAGERMNARCDSHARAHAHGRDGQPGPRRLDERSRASGSASSELANGTTAGGRAPASWARPSKTQRTPPSPHTHAHIQNRTANAPRPPRSASTQPRLSLDSASTQPRLSRT